MQTLLLIGFMVVIGAFIGGMTNALAIRMLFRPYNEIIIGSWRLPFTPGLIPKRRDEIAGQLGKMVVDYLITAEGLAKKFKSASFTEELIDWLRDRTKRILQSETITSDLLSQFLGVKESKKIILEKTELFIREGYDTFFEVYRTKTLAEVIPKTFQEKIEAQIPHLTKYILAQGQDYLLRPEGKERLSEMIERFLAQKGKIGNMVSMFLGQERLADKVHPEIMKFLQDEGTERLVENLIFQEWNKVKDNPLAYFEKYLKKEEIVQLFVRTIDKQIPFYKWLDQPLIAWTPTYEKMILEEIVPKGIYLMLDSIVIHVESLLERLHLDEIIREQVQAFSIERLEELVLSIAKRELKMITLLGALLGGAIGLIQSFIVIING